MEVTLPVSSLIIISIGAIGVAVSIATSFIFFYKKRNGHNSDVFFALLLLVIGLTFLNDMLMTSGIASRFKNLYFIPIFYSLSIGPLFYLFVKSKYYHRLSKIDYVHLALPILQALFYLSIGFRTVEYKSSLWASQVFRNCLTVEALLFSIGLVFYSLLARLLLNKPNDQNYFWNSDLKNWLTKLANAFLFVALLEMVISIGEYFLNYQFETIFFLLRSSIFGVFICWVAFNAIKLLYPSSIYQTNPKKKASVLGTGEANQIKTELLRLMKEDKVYLNADLTLGILSEYLETTEKKCSHLLRTELDSNFNQFINSYRIESFKEKVKEGKHREFTLLALAYESGFESKSTFNRHFKLLNGMTPSQFIKSYEKTT